MQIHDRIFSDKYIESKAAGFDIMSVKDIEKKLEIVRDWQAGIRSKRILNAKEEELQSAFLYRFFGDILGYIYAKGAKQWHLDVEQKTFADSSRMDGALGFFSLDEKGKTLSDIRVVVELKKARSDLDKPQNRKNDRRTPVQQAFDYAHSVGGTCRWVIVSNFVEIRFYCQNDRSRYESFDISELDKAEAFRRFLFLLQKDRLLSQSGESYTDKLYRERQEQEEKISKAFYNDYKNARITLFHHLRAQHPGIDELTMLNKTQKILDRVLFVCFCEDLNILPPYTFRNLLKSVKADKFNRDETKIYARVRGLFDAINSGYPEENINRFNGGLFAEDEVLDKLLIKDEVFEQVVGLERYDFASDLNVNILGHIFEQSVSDIEELRAGIAGESFDRRQGKRKKEGIFYTPEYITRYIVEEAVGGWLADRKAEIGFDSLPELTEADYAASKIVRNKLKTNDNVKMHIQASEAYRNRLANIKVLDPACGSGAFLNQVFDYLYKEGQQVNDELARLKAGQREIYDLDKTILTGNIFGVDLNPESVEITKLSLWLKTANRNKELTTLDDNIKCGNSLIDDPAVAGDKAFDWCREFPEIMADGGFDVVVGNPPWGAELSEKEINYISLNYQGNITGEVDTYIVFMFKSFFLIKNSGYIGLIIPDTWLTLKRALNLRNYIYNKMTLVDIHDRYKPFEDAKDTRSHTIILKHNNSRLNYDFSVKFVDAKQNVMKDYTLSSSVLQNMTAWNLYVSQQELGIFQKMEKCSEKLGEICNLKYGLRTGNNKKYLADRDVNRLNYKIARGSHIKRYYFDWKEEYLITTEGLPLSYFEEECLKDKIIIQRIRTNSTDFRSRWLESAYIEDSNFLALDSTTFIYKKGELSLKYLLAVFSSYLMNYYYKAHYTDVNVKPIYLENLPIPNISISRQQPFIEKADIMLSQNKALHEMRSDFLNFLQSELKPEKIGKHLEKWDESDWDGFRKELAKGGVKISELSLKARKEWQDYFAERKAETGKIKAVIEETDREIDRMVYALYGLSEDEIQIVNQGER
jgi:type I restriction-modification system DNA methylase subunit